jgi:succinate dehydrogenase / fumarate reductase cytochrome b subunit
MTERPLSPHLQIYRWQITMAMSILHRATGVALTIGLFVMAWWLLAAASGPEAYDQFRHCASSPFGLFVLAGFSYALFYHFCTGIRHLFLDSGMFYGIPEIYKSGYVTIAASIVLTVSFWLAIIF